MMVLDEFAVLGAAIQTYGPRAQQAMLLEEMAELQKEICKNWRGRDNLAEIAEEIADVEIMLDQIKMIFCCAGRVKAIRASKIRRLEERIRDEIVASAAETAGDPEPGGFVFEIPKGKEGSTFFAAGGGGGKDGVR